ncbi:MAG TPA: hypothetical protein VFZ16_09040 [Hyphomicrobiaceae bacterium]|nr:hypothetical protein [Hyphomicrobiaceae bacterium]
MNIPYTYLAVLLVFTLLIGVVIGDRLAAGTGVENDGYGHSGGCAGLASARLHDCVHREGYLRTRRTARSGAGTWPDGSASCELPEAPRGD